MVFLIFNFLYRFALRWEQKRMKKISLCSHGTVGNFSSLAKKETSRTKGEETHSKKCKNLIKASTYERTSKPRAPPSRGMMAQERWYKYLKWCEYWEALSQGSRSNIKSQGPILKTLCPHRAKQKLKLKAFRSWRTVKIKSFWNLRARTWSDARPPGRESQAVERNPDETGSQQPSQEATYWEMMCPFSIFSSLALQTHISTGMLYYVLGFWNATWRFWRGGGKNTHFMWIPNFWNRCTYLCYDKTLVRKRCCDSLMRKVRMV